MERIVLAYSGALDTSIAIPWLAERYGAEIITVTLDLGQGKEFLEEVRDRSLATGALRAHVVDVRDEFARGFVVRALKAGLLGGDDSPTGAVLGRPLVAQTLVTIAHIEQATAVAHGDSGGNAASLEAAVQSLDPMLQVVAPADEWGMTPAQQAAYGRERGVAVAATQTSGFDGRVVRARHASDLPEEAASVDIAFERGAPTVINGVVMPLLDLFGSLDIIAGAHGVGRPAVLHAAHQALQRSTVDARAAAFAAQVAAEYHRILREGSWFTPLREALDACVDKIQERVTGVVCLKLLDGNCTVVDCTAATVPPTTFIALTKAH